jgi:Beta-propeller repeat
MLDVKLCFILTIFFFFSFCYSVNSQTYEEIVAQMEAEFNTFAKQNEDIFETFSDENDNIFVEHLKESWKVYNLNIGIDPQTAPKPDYIRQFAENTSSTNNQVDIKNIEQQINLKNKLVQPILKKKEDVSFETNSGSIDFYGRTIDYSYDRRFLNQKITSYTENDIADYWEKMSETNYNHFIKQITDYKLEMNLNDWGYYKLLEKAAIKIFPDSENQSNLFIWFMFSKSSYKVRIARVNSNSIKLLLPSINTIYGLKFKDFKGIRYYLINSNETDIFTYETDFADSKLLLDFNIYKTIHISNEIAVKDLKYEIDGKVENISLKYNPNIVKFFKDYPLVSAKIYLDATASLVFKESIAIELKSQLDKMSNVESVNYLLKFAQNAFEYKTDKNQFGSEKFCFPEETLFYPYSDCEDRSFLFAYLVRELLNIDIIGLGYDGHFAVGVELNDNTAGDYVSFKGKKYIITDPTYKNAPIGSILDEFKGKQAVIYNIDNLQYEKTRQNIVWNAIFESGGSRGSNERNIVFDEVGNAYVTGFFDGIVSFGNEEFESVDNSHDIFIAKYNKDANLLWVRKGGGAGNDIGNEIAIDTENNSYVTGCFEINDKSDVFLSKYDSNGKILWTSSVGLDTANKKNNLIYVADFTPAGKLRNTKFFNEEESFLNYGITINEDKSITLTGLLASSLGFSVSNLSFDAFSDYNAPEIWKKENDRLIQLKYNEAIAGLFAFLNTAKLSGTNISGKTIQSALDKYNPNFRKSNSVIYENIGDMNFVRNKDGVIVILTEGEKDIYFDNLKIPHRTKIKVVTYKTGNTQIDVLSGASIGQTYVRFDLNYIKLIKDTGDLLFDYSVDHSQQKLNLSNDILY